MAFLHPKGHLSLLFAAVAVVLCLMADLAAAIPQIRPGSDPSAIVVGKTYYSVESAGGGIHLRAASSIEGLGAKDVKRTEVFSDPDKIGGIWAPELVMDNGKPFIYFAAGAGDKKRIYVVSADKPEGPYTKKATKLNLPDDKWAIDGTMFNFGDKRWFVWSGWAGDSGGEQSLYICQLETPTKAVGKRYVISQPREGWEVKEGKINEGPEAMVDPNGQLHIVYSANGSWGSKYCLADLRLKKGGNPTYVWDWYKSNGCLFGSHQENMMKGWDATKSIDGPGHNTFIPPDGDINKTPENTHKNPMIYHGVPKGTPYKWGNRKWYQGSWVWWSKTKYHRANVPGDNDNVGYSLKMFE